MEKLPLSKSLSELVKQGTGNRLITKNKTKIRFFKNYKCIFMIILNEYLFIHYFSNVNPLKIIFNF